eukprot:542929-Pyramimonas_sp.AAC.1
MAAPSFANQGPRPRVGHIRFNTSKGYADVVGGFNMWLSPPLPRTCFLRFPTVTRMETSVRSERGSRVKHRELLRPEVPERANVYAVGG